MTALNAERNAILKTLPVTRPSAGDLETSIHDYDQGQRLHSPKKARS